MKKLLWSDKDIITLMTVLRIRIRDLVLVDPWTRDSIIFQGFAFKLIFTIVAPSVADPGSGAFFPDPGNEIPHAPGSEIPRDLG